MNTIKKIAVLLTCYNRREKTISCLKALFEATLPTEFMLDVFLVDDGCTDGTAVAVKAVYPKVKIIQGDGKLFWNKGMRLAWESATKVQEYDFYLWLNDDSTIHRSGLISLLGAAKNDNIMVGATVSSIDNKITYGGRIIKNGLLGLSDNVQKCDYFNGNIVLIPQEVFRNLGFNDQKFHHGLGDFDYGFRARKKGVQLLVAPNFCGYCEPNLTTKSWETKKVSVKDRFLLFQSPLGNNPQEYFIYDFRHNGLISAVSHYCYAYVKFLYISLVKK